MAECAIKCVEAAKFRRKFGMSIILIYIKGLWTKVKLRSFYNKGDKYII